jgi:hypothetical protein
MIELLELLLTILGSVFRSGKRLILENLILRQQLQVAPPVPTPAPPSQPTVGAAPLALDDQAVIVNVRDRGLVIITGCGHAGWSTPPATRRR